MGSHIVRVRLSRRVLTFNNLRAVCGFIEADPPTISTCQVIVQSFHSLDTSSPDISRYLLLI